MFVRRSLSLLVCSLALVVAGCGEDEPTPNIAPPSESPSVAPTPTEAASEAAAEETPEQFIQRWTDVEMQMQNTGETAPYLAITRGCQSCEDLARRIKNFYGSGGYVRWEGRTILRVKALNDEAFRVAFKSGTTEYRESANAEVQRFDGGRALYELELEKVAETYVLRNIVEID